MVPSRRALGFGCLAALLAACTAALGSAISVAESRPYDFGVIPARATLRWLSLGHPTLAANLHWLRAVQYMGEPRAHERGWDKLFPVLDLVTDLDPRHGYAYQVGANTLGANGRIGESNAILEKGTRNVADRYILPFHRAVNAFLYQGDYAEAGRWFEKAAATPGAPARMREYVVAMYVKGSAPDAALSFLDHLYREAEDDESRKAIRKQMNQALLERDAALLEAGVDAYRARHALEPVALAQLVWDGVLGSLPADPFGGTYYLGADGRVRSSVNDRRFERPLSDAARLQTLEAARRSAQRTAEQTLP